MENKDTTRRKQATQLIANGVYGFIPPQAKDLEEAVLGAILLEKDAFVRIAHILKPETFYVDSHQKIFEVC
jgi:replicative DNA helicase